MTFSTVAATSIRKLGPVAIADKMKRKKVEGQMKTPSRNAKGRPRNTPYNPPSDP